MFRDGVARVLVFRVGGERFAVSLPAVAEVIESPELQRMPDAPEHVRGVATLRGELLSVYDPLALLGASGTGAPVPSTKAGEASGAGRRSSSAAPVGTESALPSTTCTTRSRSRSRSCAACRAATDPTVRSSVSCYAGRS